MLRNPAHLTVAAGALLGAALTSTMVMRTTQAVFSGTTTTPTNSWTTGGAQITNDHTATAVFSTGADGTLTGGQVVQRCVTVTYQGTTTTGVSVKLYGTTSGALASNLQLTVDQGSGATGGVGSCTSFTPSTSGIYSGTLAGIPGTFASGSGSWAPTAVNSTMQYRFTITVPNTTAAQNSSATGSFTWEAQA